MAKNKVEEPEQAGKPSASAKRDENGESQGHEAKGKSKKKEKEKTEKTDRLTRTTISFSATVSALPSLKLKSVCSHSGLIAHAHPITFLMQMLQVSSWLVDHLHSYPRPRIPRSPRFGHSHYNQGRLAAGRIQAVHQRQSQRRA